MERHEELFRFDEQYLQGRRVALAGVDEVGRGPLAGPVVAAAVILKKNASLARLNDSKKLSPQARETLFTQILAQGFAGIGCVSEAIIDKINILQATRLAMRQAVLALPRTPDLLFIDGDIKLDVPLPQKSFVRGDARSAAIAAASIVAKVYRDTLMEKFDELYPDYGFGVHKGYPTPGHLEALSQKGVTPIHRKTFAPVAGILRQE